MNQQEKEEYLREYSILKSQGKPFFPYAVAKDSLMGVVVIAVIIVMALLFLPRYCNSSTRSKNMKSARKPSTTKVMVARTSR